MRAPGRSRLPVLGLVAVAALAACFDPSLDQLACDVDDGCPPGYLCVDGDCHPAEATGKLLVKLATGGAGAVSATGIDCGHDCSERFLRGTVVSLTAAAATAPLADQSTFAGWSASGCSGTGPCEVTIDRDEVPIVANFARVPNIAFVTSTVHQGDLGGTAGADAICQARAGEAGLAGTYRAWLATRTREAHERLGHGSGWVRTDGKPLAATREDLLRMPLLYPLRLSEHGVDLGPVRIYTGVSSNGESDGDHCQDWTARDDLSYGLINPTSDTRAFWSYDAVVPCSGSHHLACLGIDRAAIAPPPVPVAGRVAFITSRSFDVRSGLAGADAICQQDAVEAGVPGTFRALLATEGASAASRFAPGGPVVRLDGAVVAAGHDFFTAPLWDASLATDARGQISGQLVLTGAPDPMTPGTADSTCHGWSAHVGAVGVGHPFDTLVANAFSWFTVACDGAPLLSTLHVYCLQA